MASDLRPRPPSSSFRKKAFWFSLGTALTTAFAIGLFNPSSVDSPAVGETVVEAVVEDTPISTSQASATRAASAAGAAAETHTESTSASNSAPGTALRPNEESAEHHHEIAERPRHLQQSDVFTDRALPPTAIGSDGELNPREVLKASLDVLRDRSDSFKNASDADFALGELKTVQTEHVTPQTYIEYEQVVAGLPVEGAGLNAMVKNGKIVHIQATEAKGVPNRPVRAQIDAAAALELARSQAQATGPTNEIWRQKAQRSFRDGGWRATRTYEFVGNKSRVIVDIESGKTWVESAEHSLYGMSAGYGIETLDPDAEEQRLAWLPLQWLEVTLDSGAKIHTDGEGRFTLPADPAARSGEARLSGRYVKVSSQQGEELVARADFSSDPRPVLSFNDREATEQSTAQVTAYYHVNVIHDWLAKRGIPTKPIDIALRTKVNLADHCNAYYTPGYAGLNFFSFGKIEGRDTTLICRNSAFDSVVYHEYGHFVDDRFGGIRDGGLSEGWGDVLSNFITGRPEVGAGLFKDGRGQSYVRTAENSYEYPKSGRDKVHSLGQAWMGFAWQVRKGLIEKYGAERGAKWAEELILPSLVSNARDIPSAVRETLARDDDDGNPANGSPHFEILQAAAEKHALQGFLSF